MLIRHEFQQKNLFSDVALATNAFFEHRPTLRFYVVAHNISLCIERHAGDFFAPAHARSNTGKEQQITDAFGVRERADRFGRARAFEGLAHLPFCIEQERAAYYPPAMAPMIKKGSAPVTTASGNGVSGGSCDTSCSQAKNLTSARR
jgi:hypothetical protein